MTDPVHDEPDRLIDRWRHRHDDDDDREPDPTLVRPIPGDSPEARDFQDLINDLDPNDRFNR